MIPIDTLSTIVFSNDNGNRTILHKKISTSNSSKIPILRCLMTIK